MQDDSDGVFTSYAGKNDNNRLSWEDIFSHRLEIRMGHCSCKSVKELPSVSSQ